VTRRRKRLIAIITILIVFLVILVATIINYQATKRLAMPFITVAEDTLTSPEYLYSFSGVGDTRLERPTGVYADGSRVFVTDARLGQVFEFNPEGELQGTFGADELTTPLYIAENPADGRLYITDRRNRSIAIFTKDGTYEGEFDPALPESELPDFETGDVQWAPLALDFDNDGRLYATEILNGHRLMIFDADGKFERSVGTAGQSDASGSQPELFFFPNGVEVVGEEVWVADSNNRRLKAYTLGGELLRLVPTEGLPRGFDAIRPLSEEDTRTILAVADTLAHDVTLWDGEGGRLLTFGTRGFLEGQFFYPNDVSVDEMNRIFVVDGANARIQVWGWPTEVAPVPAVEVPAYWLLCLSPLLLLPLLLLARRKRFLATAEFIDAMVEGELVDQMAHGRGRKYWMATPADYESYRGVSAGDIHFEHLLHPVEHSDADARAIAERLEVDYETAALLATARRARVFCTEDLELRRMARALDIDAIDSETYIERFGKRQERR